jgi:hypothetical protein
MAGPELTGPAPYRAPVCRNPLCPGLNRRTAHLIWFNRIVCAETMTNLQILPFPPLGWPRAIIARPSSTKGAMLKGMNGPLTGTRARSVKSAVRKS